MPLYPCPLSGCFRLLNYDVCVFMHIHVCVVVLQGVLEFLDLHQLPCSDFKFFTHGGMVFLFSTSVAFSIVSEFQCMLYQLLTLCTCMSLRTVDWEMFIVKRICKPHLMKSTFGAMPRCTMYMYKQSSMGMKCEPMKLYNHYGVIIINTCHACTVHKPNNTTCDTCHACSYMYVVTGAVQWHSNGRGYLVKGNVLFSLVLTLSASSATCR